MFFPRARNFVRREVIRWVLPVIPSSVATLLRHSLDRPFGNRYYQDRALKYDELREHQLSWKGENRALRDMAAGLGRGLSVLDVPVGSGRFFSIYSELDWTVTGLDASSEMLNVARNRMGSASEMKPVLLEGKATALPFADSEFDVVVCFRFLQSIVSFGNAQIVIGEIARVTKRYAILHLDVRPEGLPEVRPPKLRATMRGNLTWPQIVSLLESKGLYIQKKIGPMPHETKNEFVVLCAVEDVYRIT